MEEQEAQPLAESADKKEEDLKMVWKLYEKVDKFIEEHGSDTQVQDDLWRKQIARKLFMMDVRFQETDVKLKKTLENQLKMDEKLDALQKMLQQHLAAKDVKNIWKSSLRGGRMGTMSKGHHRWTRHGHRTALIWIWSVAMSIIGRLSCNPSNAANSPYLTTSQHWKGEAFARVLPSLFFLGPGLGQCRWYFTPSQKAWQL